VRRDACAPEFFASGIDDLGRIPLATFVCLKLSFRIDRRAAGCAGEADGDVRQDLVQVIQRFYELYIQPYINPTSDRDRRGSEIVFFVLK
jgi:hypothetical protein